MSSCFSLSATEPGDLWGSDTFKGCKFCRRQRNHPNPVVSELEQYPTLRFRSDRHTECNICYGVQRQTNPLRCKRKYAETMRTSDAEFQTYVETVQRYEDQINGVAPKIRRKHGEGLVAPSALQATINSVEGTVLEARKFLGIFWPTAIYEKAVGKKLTRAELGEVTHNGEKVKGIFRPEQHGRPVGTFEMWATGYSGVEKQEGLHNKEASLREGESADVFKAAQRHVKVTPVVKEIDGISAISMRTAPKINPDEDELDDLWSFGTSSVFHNKTAVGEDDAKAAPPEKKPRGGRGRGRGGHQGACEGGSAGVPASFDEDAPLIPPPEKKKKTKV